MRWPDVTDGVALGEGITLVKDPLTASRHPTAPGDGGQHSGVGTHRRLTHQPTGERRIEHALVDEGVVQRQLPTRVHTCHPGAGAGAAR